MQSVTMIIIRDMNEMERVRKYIRNNPLAQ